ncbi:hypothetical protein [Rhizobium sp. 18055]|jgi:hypothetical protein|uniref:hypothetical protein n=1 Tax=Rhizobium sp. 18055 TaxID=2681403 RepID=UPI001356ED14|nr:hypothetical protein [Rhizobium sp. 18055]
MFVISIDDHGDERNFLATSFNIDRGIVVATICGQARKFNAADVIDILPVKPLSPRNDQFIASHREPYRMHG